MSEPQYVIDLTGVRVQEGKHKDGPGQYMVTLVSDDTPDTIQYLTHARDVKAARNHADLGVVKWMGSVGPFWKVLGVARIGE